MTRAVLVTGGSAGLGAALCARLASDGWSVHAASRRGTPPSSAPDVQGLVADVMDPHAMETAVAAIVEAEGRLDAILCNAGVNRSAPAEELGLADAHAVMETNFWGVVHAVRAALPRFRAQAAGRILVVGSLAGVVSPPGEAIYAASKHAVRGWLESLQYEVSGLGVRVHLVEPGYIRTDLAKKTPPPEGAIGDYDGLRERLAGRWRDAIAGGMEPDEAAARIARILDDPKAPFRVAVGRDGTWVPRLKAVLPERLFFAGARRRFGLA